MQDIEEGQSTSINAFLAYAQDLALDLSRNLMKQLDLEYRVKLYNETQCLS